MGLAGRLLAPEVDGQPVARSQALAETASRLQQVIDQHGPQAVAFYASGQLLTEDYYAANKLMKGFIGAANIDTNSRLCMSSAVTGYKRAFGADVVPCSYEDVENSDLVVLVGSNAAGRTRCCTSVWRRRSGIIPGCRSWRSTPTHCHLRDRRSPSGAGAGSDGGLFVGLLNAPAQAGACVDGFRDGPQALAAARGWDVAKVAAFCGLPADEVAGFYRDFIAPRGPSPSTPWELTSQPAAATNVMPSSTFIWPAESMAAAAAALSLTGQPNAMGGREVGGLATMLAAHMDFVPDDLQRLARFGEPSGWRRPRG